MTHTLRAIVIFCTASIAVFAQQTPQQVPSISQRPTGASLGTIRIGAADNNLWFGWRVAIPSTAIKSLTLSEALAKSDVMGVAGVEASSTQLVSAEVPKPLDFRLQIGERNALIYRLRELNQQIVAYRLDRLAGDDATRRKTFEFAKAINAPTIILPGEAAVIPDLERLADEFSVNVALDAKAANVRSLMTALENRSKRLGLSTDVPADLPAIKSRLLNVRVTLGGETGQSGEFFLAAFRAGVKPLSITVQSMGQTEADVVTTLGTFERVMLPAMAERVRQVVASPAGQIRGPDRLSADMRQQIDAAVPRKAPATPSRPRKLLVTDLQMYSGHDTIPHGNLLLELMAKYTGAFEPTFSNDLELLKYPKIKEFDAIYLNNVCGMIHNDPDVRDGILRFVREGGGIGGHHAVTFTDNNWPEFAEMMGGWSGAHHVEKQVIKIDDPKSPLTASFGSQSFEHTDEFYQFPMYSPYSREKQHVLLSIDVELSDRATNDRLCAACTRSDQDYGLAWIRTYGKGRTYFTPLGHTTTFYTDSRWTQHLLAAIQYILGDLDADARPSAKR